MDAKVQTGLVLAAMTMALLASAAMFWGLAVLTSKFVASLSTWKPLSDSLDSLSRWGRQSLLFALKVITPVGRFFGVALSTLVSFPWAASLKTVIAVAFVGTVYFLPGAVIATTPFNFQGALGVYVGGLTLGVIIAVGVGIYGIVRGSGGKPVREFIVASLVATPWVLSAAFVTLILPVFLGD